ncbi:MAG: hypothetical protein ACRBN8_33815 [Nannocystales bacterium]
MRRHIALSFFSAAVLLGGCGDDFTSSGSSKVDSDEQEMTLDPDGDGVAEGQEAGDLAAMSFELSEPLPEIAEAEVDHGGSVHRSFDATNDFALETIAEAIEVNVASPRTGVSLSLTADGMLVPAPPSGPGEWSLTLSDDRREVSLQWYNEAAGGTRIQSGQSYQVVYSLDANCCLESVGETAIEFTLGG